MIQANYYQGFKKMCERNPKITRIPTKEELENAGCELSGMCYLVIKGGAQYNPSAVNPEIIEDSKVALLFVDRTPKVELPEEKNPAEETKTPPTPKNELVAKICDQCHESKPLSGFRRKANKVPTWFNTCIQCQAKARHKPAEEAKPEPQPEPKPEEPKGKYCPKCDTIKDANSQFGDNSPICLECEVKERTEALSKITTEPTKTAFDDVIDNKIGSVKESEQYVRLSKVREYVKRAYELGVKETLEKLNIQEPTFEELMEDIDL